MPESKYESDVAYFRALSVSTEKRTAREWAELEPEVRRGKFFLASVEDERLLGGFRRMIEGCMAEGVSEAEFVNRATEMLRALKDPAGTPYYDPTRFALMTDDEKRAYQRTQGNIDSLYRLRLIYRTQSEIAAGFREFQQAFEPFWLEMYPGWRFVRQPGAKEKYKRPLHVAHENEVHLKTDTAFWLAMNAPEIGGFNNPYPPFGYNSWMRVAPVSREECEELGLLRRGERLPIPPELVRWGLAQAVQGSDTASVRGLTPEAVERVVTRNADRGTTLVPAGADQLTPAPIEPRIAPPEATTMPKQTPEAEMLRIYALQRLAQQNKPQRKDFRTEAEYRKAYNAWRDKFFGKRKVQTSMFT